MTYVPGWFYRCVSVCIMCVFVCVCMSFRQLQVSGSECPECFRDFNPRNMLFCMILKPGIERSMMIYAPL